jgi:hypothetical protein
MSLRPDNKKRKSLFPYHPEVKFLIIFLSVIVSIPIVTYVIFYFLILPGWLEPNPKEFHNIQETLVKYGNISSKKSDELSYSDISGSNYSYTKEAVKLAQLDVSGNFLPRLMLPLVVVLGIFVSFTRKFWIPGVTKRSKPEDQKEEEQILNRLPGKTLDFLNDYNKVIITVDGFIISILGGFLVSSGLNNFYFFLGFETIVFSLISSVLAYPSFISSIKPKETLAKPDNGITMDIPILKGYYQIATFAAVSLILGLILVAASF